MISVSRDGVIVGKFTDDQITQLLRAGELLPSDLYWTVEMKDWQHLVMWRPKPTFRSNLMTAVVMNLVILVGASIAIGIGTALQHYRDKKEEQRHERLVRMQIESDRVTGALTRFRGKVLQHVVGGLLVECEGDGVSVRGTVFLTHYPDGERIADERRISGVCESKGTFQYPTVLGATKTVERYRWRPDGIK